MQIVVVQNTLVFASHDYVTVLFVSRCRGHNVRVLHTRRARARPPFGHTKNKNELIDRKYGTRAPARPLVVYKMYGRHYGVIAFYFFSFASSETATSVGSHVHGLQDRSSDDLLLSLPHCYYGNRFFFGKPGLSSFMIKKKNCVIFTIFLFSLRNYTR